MVLSTLHLILVISFVSVTALLLSLTVLQRIRIRRVRMTWRSSRVSRVPIWPILFVGAVTVFLVYAQNIFPAIHLSVYLGYLLGGILWFIAVILSSTSVITDYGIIPEIGRSGEAVAWGQISDYFEVKDERRVYFVFIYQDFIGVRQRLELAVPVIEVDRFSSIVRSKLDIRVEESVYEMTDSKAIERE
ncbi:MAG: hypothetical protein O7C39_02355 [Bacteroidetes bacterium]|nr:hypothetical protein [Bacteroidota bacterium]